MKQNIILLVVASLSLAIATSDKVLLKQETNPLLLSLMARTNSMSHRNGERSTLCFNYYIPLIDEIAKAYQRNHDTCLQTSRDGRSQAEAATLDKRNNLASSVNSSCDLLKQCSDEIKSAEEVFECYIAGGSENTKKMYTINANASEHLADLQEQFRLVENKEYKCTNETKREYEKDSTNAYADFNNCIMGIIDVPTSTEAPAQTEPSKEPETTTSTKKPENTENTTEAVTEKTEGPLSPEDPISPQSRGAYERFIKRATPYKKPSYLF